jgi:Methyltransferase domain
MADKFTDRGKPSDDPAFTARDPIRRPGVFEAIMQLNRAISVTGEDIEGNVCYWDGTPARVYLVAEPTNDAAHVGKRINLFELSKRHRSMLEIGLNGGHSAILCLLANPDLHLFSVDVCSHTYVESAATYLKKAFGRRFHFWKGDSRELLPRVAVDYPNLRFDLFHIDGGHGSGLAYADISNSIRMASVGAELIFDDINATHLNDILEAFVKMGYLCPPNEAYPVDSGLSICSRRRAWGRLALLRGLSRLMMSQ